MMMMVLMTMSLYGLIMMKSQNHYYSLRPSARRQRPRGRAGRIAKPFAGLREGGDGWGRMGFLYRARRDDVSWGFPNLWEERRRGVGGRLVVDLVCLLARHMTRLIGV